MHKSPVSYHNSFIAIEIYIFMISMMMLDITIEVSVNIGLPLKGRTQSWLGHFLGTSGHFWKPLSLDKFWKLGNFVLLDFGLNLLKARNNKLDKCLI